MQLAQAVHQSLYDLTIVLSIMLSAVIAGTVCYFVYASRMELEP